MNASACLIGCGSLTAVDTEHVFESAPRPSDPTFYRADRATAYRGCFVVAETFGTYQHQGFPLFGWQDAIRVPEIVEFQHR
jgi:hypothetical protein